MKLQCPNCHAVHTHVEWNWETIVYFDKIRSNNGHNTARIGLLKGKGVEDKSSWYICPSCSKQVGYSGMVRKDVPTSV